MFFSMQSRAQLILSVDDDAAVLHARDLLLSAAGYSVISGRDAAEALDLFGNNPIDLVLLDYALPVLDGGLVAEAMKVYEPRVPIIMISGAEVPPKGLFHVNRYLRKAESPEVLLAAIRELLLSSVRERSGQELSDNPTSPH